MELQLLQLDGSTSQRLDREGSTNCKRFCEPPTNDKYLRERPFRLAVTPRMRPLANPNRRQFNLRTPLQLNALGQTLLPCLPSHSVCQHSRRLLRWPSDGRLGRSREIQSGVDLVSRRWCGGGLVGWRPRQGWRIRPRRRSRRWRHRRGSRRLVVWSVSWRRPHRQHRRCHDWGDPAARHRAIHQARIAAEPSSSTAALCCSRSAPALLRRSSGTGCARPDIAGQHC